MNGLIGLIVILLQVLAFSIFARAVISWFPIDRNGPVVRALDAITEPILEPLRRVVPRFGAMDLTPMIAMILLFVIASVLANAAGTS